MGRMQEIRDLFTSYLSVSDHDLIMIDFSYAVAASVFRTGSFEPVWGIIAGPPGCGKSETVISFGGCPDVIPLSQLTPRSLVSGFRDKDDPDKDPSLLPKLKNKVLCIEDFTGVLSMPQKEKAQVFSQFREGFSEKYDATFGNIGTVSYRDIRFSFLAGCTEAIYGELESDQKLGQRFMLLHVGGRQSWASRQDRASAACSARDHKGEARIKAKHRSAEMMREISIDMKRRVHRIGCSSEMAEKISTLANLVTAYRTGLLPGGEVAELEHPTRLAQQLTNLGESRILVDQRLDWNNDDLNFIARVAHDTMPISARRILQKLIDRETTHPGQGLSDNGIIDGQLSERKVGEYLRQWYGSGLLERWAGRYRLSGEKLELFKMTGLVVPV